MRTLAFSNRCVKEILRDPLSLSFGLGFPLILLFLLSTISKNIPNDLFQIETLAPGIPVFGLSFMTLFSATLIAKDRESALLQRLFTTPLTATDFIIGYMVSMLPIAVIQTVICYLFAVPLGLNMCVNIVYSIVAIIPMAVFNISFGLLCGSLLSVKQVGGICGALLTNLSAWFSGIWFDPDLAGGTFKWISDILPFSHAVEMEIALYHGNFEIATQHILPIVLYSLLTTLLAVLCFLKRMKKQ